MGWGIFKKSCSICLISILQKMFLINCIFRVCPDPDVTFHLYTQHNPEIPEKISAGINRLESNLNETAFDPLKPSKIIIHGYNSDMNLPVLVEIRKGKLFFKIKSIEFIE